MKLKHWYIIVIHKHQGENKIPGRSTTEGKIEIKKCRGELSQKTDVEVQE